MTGINENDIDKRKAEQMVKKVIILSKYNNKANKYSDSEMTKKIINIIREEIECY